MPSENKIDGMELLKIQMTHILKQTLNMSDEEIKQNVTEYIDFNEPQLAYSNLVAIIVNSGLRIGSDVYNEVVALGEELQIGDGIVWDESEAQDWWGKLEELVG